MLALEEVEVFYGRSQVLFGMTLTVGAGEVVTLLGRNGAGKSSTVRALMNLVRPVRGRVVFEGEDITGLPPFKVAQRGVGLVPEGRQIFPKLTVRENLVATARPPGEGSRRRWTVEKAVEVFPGLRDRLGSYGNQLSGGEQQMLAIARAMMTHPKLLVLDEATEGLAPLVRAEIWDGLRSLKEQGQAILVIDKNIQALARIADRHYIVSKGRCVWSGTSSELLSDPGLHARHLGV